MMQDESNGRKLSTLIRYQAHFKRSYHRGIRQEPPLNSQ